MNTALATVMTTDDLPRILLVEDSEDDALLVQHELRAAVGPASYRRVDDEASLRDALKSPWDLVICDHRMPGFDSTRALALVKEQAPHTPLVIYSGHLESDRAVAAMRAGAHDFVDKHDRARLAPVVQRELRGSKIRRDQLQAEASVIELAHFDPLTRLLNRDSFAARLDGTLSRSNRADAPALLVIDLDRFRRVNDSHGYAVGDCAIREAGDLLATMAGERTSAARLGPNKFALFLPRNPSERTALAFARRLAQRFEEGFRLPEGEIHFTVSVGLALAPGHGECAGELLRNAESACHQSKATGGNRIHVYDRAMNVAAARKLALENALRLAVEREELTLAYQPIVDLESGALVAAEALLRWDHPVLGPVGPGEFIGLAEESGLIAPMGQWALERALADTRSILERGHENFRMAVNFSAAQFRIENIADHVHMALARAAVPPGALEIEITESLALDRTSGTTGALASLRRAGVHLAIDDFGTGFASLSALQRFPFDILKIDKGFIAGLPGGREDCAIVGSLAALSRGLGTTLHAEGVETRAQHDWLVAAGCQRAQGHLYGRAASAGQLLAHLQGEPLARC